MVIENDYIGIQIERFLKPNVTTIKKTIVRLFERGRSVEDFSITYRRCYGKEGAPFLPVLNFSIQKDESGFHFIKSSPKSTTSVKAAAPPDGYSFKETKNKRIISVYFNCDLIYMNKNKRRYND